MSDNHGKFERQYFLQNGRCFWCQLFTLPSQLTRDHVTPKADGGSNDWGNLILVHKKCNEARSKLVIGSIRFDKWLRKVMRGQIYKFVRRETFVHNAT